MSWNISELTSNNKQEEEIKTFMNFSLSKLLGSRLCTNKKNQIIDILKYFTTSITIWGRRMDTGKTK